MRETPTLSFGILRVVERDGKVQTQGDDGDIHSQAQTSAYGQLGDKGLEGKVSVWKFVGRT